MLSLHFDEKNVAENVGEMRRSLVTSGRMAILLGMVEARSVNVKKTTTGEQRCLKKNLNC